MKCMLHLLKKKVSLLLCKLQTTGAVEMKKENATVRIINISYPKQQGREKGSLDLAFRRVSSKPYLRFVYNLSFLGRVYWKWMRSFLVFQTIHSPQQVQGLSAPALSMCHAEYDFLPQRQSSSSIFEEISLLMFSGDMSLS